MALSGQKHDFGSAEQVIVQCTVFGAFIQKGVEWGFLEPLRLAQAVHPYDGGKRAVVVGRIRMGSCLQAK